MTYLQANDETPDYSCGYVDGLEGRTHNCPAGVDEDLYTEGYEAGTERRK
jgi:hypothetical protein